MEAWQIIKDQIVSLMERGGHPLSEEQEALLAGYLCAMTNKLEKKGLNHCYRRREKDGTV